MRVIAESRDLSTAVGEVCGGVDVATVAPDTSVQQAADVMRSRAVRRLPVVDGDQVVGVLSISDLAIDRDDKAALADISAASPNR